jgi:hypothetical protein
VRKNVELVNFRRLGEQVAGLGLLHQGSRDFAVEVRVTSGLVVESVEDSEARRSFLNGKPASVARVE